MSLSSQLAERGSQKTAVDLQSHFCSSTAGYLQHLLQLESLDSANDLPPLKKRLKAGCGALAHHGTYWYPVRLIQWVVKENNQKVKKWKVQWWRGCRFDKSEPQPEATSMVAGEDVTDSLWLDRHARRQIRLGHWDHPLYGYDESEDILSDPSVIPYTPDVHSALSPWTSILTTLLKKPDSLGTEVNIPAKHYLESQGKDITKHQVLFAGGLSVAERARVANWFEVHISENRRLRPDWVGCVPGAHAITLFIADQMYQQALQKDKLRGRKVEDFINQAWTLQYTEARMEEKVVDVDAECLARLEREMFTRSPGAGIAGFYQWGLDAGDHQNHWDPWKGTPSDWCSHDYQAWSESEMEPGPEFLVGPEQKIVEQPRKPQPKPRPLAKRNQIVIPAPKAPAKKKAATGRSRRQPARKAKN